jgi:hypothetical protein
MAAVYVSQRSWEQNGKQEQGRTNIKNFDTRSHTGGGGGDKIFPVERRITPSTIHER